MAEIAVVGGGTKLLTELELPLTFVLADMEAAGIAADTDRLVRLQSELGAAVADAESDAHLVVGRSFNLGSPKQLQQILFDDFGMPKTKKTKTGYSTDAQTLEKLRGEHPIIESLLRYREVEKLRSTYGESLLAEVDDRPGGMARVARELADRLARNVGGDLAHVIGRERRGIAVMRGMLPRGLKPKLLGLLALGGLQGRYATDPSWPRSLAFDLVDAAAALAALQGPGSLLREEVSADNIAEIVAALRFLLSCNESITVNLGTGRAVNMTSLAAMFCREAGYDPELNTVKDAPMGVGYRVADVTELRRFYTVLDIALQETPELQPTKPRLQASPVAQ